MTLTDLPVGKKVHAPSHLEAPAEEVTGAQRAWQILVGVRQTGAFQVMCVRDCENDMEISHHRVQTRWYTSLLCYKCYLMHI